ncbi:MAG: hypothetical protein ACW98W_17035 [Candidatus Hodarchaeales archaeon]|jgi:hypothetical protein
MKICVIGGGWVGCHLTKVFKDRHQIDLFESEEIFSKSSSNNQNRLHLGYHYCRSFHTRELCKKTFNKFSEEYSFLIDDVPNNLYAIPFNESLLDYNSYIKIFENFSTHTQKEINFLKNIEGVINTDEKFINPLKAKNYFSEILSDNLIIKNVNLDDIDSFKKKYDLVINCTNNFLDSIVDESIYLETCHALLYEKKKETSFDALTLVDGKLFSIYPYDNDKLFSLSDVEVTPKNNCSIDKKRKLMEKKVLYYYEEFLDYFEYHSFYIGKKYKYLNKSDNRIPIIRKQDNYIRTFTGKIQGIYFIQDYLEKL